MKGAEMAEKTFPDAYDERALGLWIAYRLTGQRVLSVDPANENQVAAAHTYVKLIQKLRDKLVGTPPGINVK